VTSAELVQFGEQIANLHRRRIQDAPGRGGSPPLRRGQATVERLPDHGGDRCAALPRESANPLVALIVDENLQPVRQHAHTLACAYVAGDWVPCAGRVLKGLFFPCAWTEVVVEHGGQDGRDEDSGQSLTTLLMAGSGAGPCLGGAGPVRVRASVVWVPTIVSWLLTWCLALEDGRSGLASGCAKTS